MNESSHFLYTPPLEFLEYIDEYKTSKKSKLDINKYSLELMGYKL